MSFRRKLVLFVVAIVVVPMLAAGVLVVAIGDDSSDGQADAQLASGLETARTVYDEALEEAPAEAERVASAAGPALQSGDAAGLQALAEREAAGGEIVAIEIVGPDGSPLAEAGPDDGLAGAETRVQSDSGEQLGAVSVTTLEPRVFVARVRQLTALHAAVAANRRLVESTLSLQAAELPAPGEENATLAPDESETDYRAATFALAGGPPGARLALLSERPSGFVSSRPLVAGSLLVLFGAAAFLVALLLRNLQRRVASMLAAARRIGEGNFDEEVPVEGDDEMAALAIELNRMSEKLSEQMGQLRRQRRELDRSIERIGEAFASGLDRDALLEIVVDTAVSACCAEGGHAVLRDGDVATETEPPTGLDEPLSDLLERAAEAAAADREGGRVSDGDRHAVAHAVVDRRGDERVLCTMAVARRGDAFSQEEHEILRYLAGQAIISIENIDLHERVAEQAVTDELTGVANHRHFTEWVHDETARVERFGGELSLILLDVDNFKRVNDEHGHLQGDLVLAEIGKLLGEDLREIDEAARYGGEEFVLGLPQTGTEGAIEVAERLRERIEALEVVGDNGGPPLRVTVSLGVATMPADAPDARSLIAAADAALYRAKRTGKNRVVAAGRDGVPPAGMRAAIRDI